MAEIIDEIMNGNLDDIIEKKILVVDDSATIRELLKKSFASKGYTVETADNAERALAILETNSFPVMFFDLNMPGMNGVELCKTVRENHPFSVIFAMTGFVSLFALSLCRDAGFEDYFVKPVDLKLFHYAAGEAFKKIERWNESFKNTED